MTVSRRGGGGRGEKSRASTGEAFSSSPPGRIRRIGGIAISNARTP